MDLQLAHKYRKSQINGTIYVTSCQSLPAEQRAKLETGAGELYLTRIYKRCTPDDIMRVAIEVGDVYMLRFKINFSGCSRGYAYLQYIDERQKMRALQILQQRFRQIRLKIQVRESRNRKTLILNNVSHLTPLQVHQELRQISRYLKLSVYEYQPQRYLYLIVYRNNDEAALAHHVLRTKIGNFGVSAFIDWLDKGQQTTDIDSMPNCCVQLPRHENVKAHLEQLQQQLAQTQAGCICFRI